MVDRCVHADSRGALLRECQRGEKTEGYRRAILAIEADGKAGGGESLVVSYLLATSLGRIVLASYVSLRLIITPT